MPCGHHFTMAPLTPSRPAALATGAMQAEARCSQVRWESTSWGPGLLSCPGAALCSWQDAFELSVHNQKCREAVQGVNG